MRFYKITSFLSTLATFAFSKITFLLTAWATLAFSRNIKQENYSSYATLQELHMDQVSFTYTRLSDLLLSQVASFFTNIVLTSETDTSQQIINCFCMISSSYFTISKQPFIPVQFHKKCWQYVFIIWGRKKNSTKFNHMLVEK